MQSMQSMKVLWPVLFAAIASFWIGIVFRDSLPPAYAQGAGGGTPSHGYCYTQRYNPNGTKSGNADWFPCAAGSPLWTMNQAQRSVSVVPVNGVLFEPTKFLYIGDAAPCDINMQLLGDASTKTWHVQMGFQPVQAVSIAAAGTTCTAILKLY